MEENNTEANLTTREYAIRGIIVIGTIVGITLMVRFVFSVFTLLLICILLLLTILAMLYKQGEKWLAGLILTCVIFTIIGIYSGYRLVNYTNQRTQTPQNCIQIPDSLSIYIAAEDIPKGEVMHDSMYVEILLPRDMAVEGFIFDPDLIVGRETRYALARGTLLTRGVLVELQPVSTQAP